MSETNNTIKSKKNQYHHLTKDDRAKIQSLIEQVDENGKRIFNNSYIAKYIGVLKFYNFLDYKLETLEKGGIKYNVICFTKVAVNGVPSSVPLDDKRTLEQVYEQELNEEGAAFFTKM